MTHWRGGGAWRSRSPRVGAITRVTDLRETWSKRWHVAEVRRIPGGDASRPRGGLPSTVVPCDAVPRGRRPWRSLRSEFWRSLEASHGRTSRWCHPVRRLGSTSQPETSGTYSRDRLAQAFARDPRHYDSDGARGVHVVFLPEVRRPRIAEVREPRCWRMWHVVEPDAPHHTLFG